MTGSAVKAPPLALCLTENARAMAEWALLPALCPLLARAPRGDGDGVLVLPGLLADDVDTWVLRRFLRRCGHHVQGWRLGRNVGPSEAVLDGMPTALRRLADRTGGPVSLVGWSLGGMFARELARAHPELVRQVITLASPFALVDSRQSRADWVYSAFAGRHADPSRVASREQMQQPIAVRSTAVYSRLDGIVDWRACRDQPGPRHENIAVRCSHLGMVVHPAVLWLVADRLSAQNAAQWSSYRPPSFLAAAHPARAPLPEAKDPR